MRVNSDHWDVLLDFSEKHPEIITNRVASGLSGRETFNKLWSTLTIQLNALGFGEKSTNEWKKTLADSKSKVKLKAAKINSCLTQTGGGLSEAITLSAREERLLSLMGTKSIKGDSPFEFGLVSKNQLLSSCLGKRMHGRENHEAPKKKRIIEVIPENSELPATIYSQQDEISDHNYCEVEEVVEPQTPTHTEAASYPRGSKHRRSKVELSERIAEMNTESLLVLQSIGNKLDNMNSTFIKIANDTRRIADAVEKLAKY